MTEVAQVWFLEKTCLHEKLEFKPLLFSIFLSYVRVYRPEIKNLTLPPAVSDEWSLQLSVLPCKYQRKKTRVVQIHIYTAPEYFPLSRNLLFTENWLH